MPFKFNDIWKFTTKYITTNKKVTIGIDETVKPNDNYDLNVTYKNYNNLASFNSDTIHEDTLPLNKKYVSKFNKDKNKNITITNPIINTLNFINIDDDTHQLNNSNILYDTLGTFDIGANFKLKKRNNNYFNDSLYLLYQFDISDTNTYNNDKTTFLNPMTLYSNINFNTDISHSTREYKIITNNINKLQVYNFYTIDNTFTKDNFYNFQGDKYIIGNSSLLLNNKFILYNEFEYKYKAGGSDFQSEIDSFNLKDFFPYITISFWFYIEKDSDLILFSISDSSSTNYTNNSIYYHKNLKTLKFKKYKKPNFYDDEYDIIISDNISINKWYHLSIVSHNNEGKNIMTSNVYDYYNSEYDDYSKFNLSLDSSFYITDFNKTYFILNGILQKDDNFYLFENFTDKNYIYFGSYPNLSKGKLIESSDELSDNFIKYGYIDDFRMYNTILTPKLIQKKLIGDILFINNNTINTIGNTGLIFTSFEEKLEIGNKQNNDYKLIVCGEIQSKNIKINNSNIILNSLLSIDHNCNIKSVNDVESLTIGNANIGEIILADDNLNIVNINNFKVGIKETFIFKDNFLGEDIFSYSNQQFKFSKTVHFADSTTNGSGSGSIDSGLIINGSLTTQQINVYPHVLNFKTEIGLIVDNNQYINRELLVKEDITAFFQASDKRLKNNIKPLSKSINLIKKLKPVTFKWKKDIFNKNMRNKKDVGFIAQELEEILPLCVKNVNINNDSYKYLKHERIIPYLVNTIQELIERVEYLEKKI